MKLFSSDIKRKIIDTIKDMKQFLIFLVVLTTIINSTSICVAIDSKKNNNGDDDLPITSETDEDKYIIHGNKITQVAYDFVAYDIDNVVSKNTSVKETNDVNTVDTCKGANSKVEMVTADNTLVDFLLFKKTHNNVEKDNSENADTTNYFSTEYNNITVNNMDFFSIEDKIKFICNKYNLTDFEFKVVASVVYHEACKNNYDDAYRVINTIYNRTISKTWVNWITSLTGIDGSNLYAQVIAPNQFDGCLSTSGYDYNDLLNEVNYDGTKLFEITLDAIFDFLISEKSIHNFLSFKGCGYSVSESEKMKEGYGITDWVKYTDFGNTYHNPLTDDDVTEGHTLVSTQGNVLTRKRG